MFKNTKKHVFQPFLIFHQTLKNIFFMFFNIFQIIQKKGKH
jgi:hypothetical protein